VETRFDGSTVGSTKEHLSVKTTTGAASRACSVVGIRSFDLLTKNAKAGSSIAVKTRTALLKQKALGDNAIRYDDRTYLMINLPHPPGISLCVFFPDHMSLGEALHRIANTYSSQCFGVPTRPDSKSIQIRGGEELDMNSPLREVFDKPSGDMKEVDLEVILTKDLVARIAKESAAARAAAAAASPPAPLPASPSPPESSNPCIVAENVKVGDEVLYVKEGANDRVKISCVHRDDFPSLYFSIVFLDASGREKQTVAQHLRALPPQPLRFAGELAPETAGAFAINISHGNNHFPFLVLPNTTVGALKKALSEGRAPGCTANSRVISKGKVLSNDVRMSSIRPGSKLILL